MDDQEKAETPVRVASELNDRLGEVRRTARGFQYIGWQDRNGQACELQQSSLAEYEPPGTSAVWLGLRGERMHIDLEQAKALVMHLQKWIEDGVFA